MEGELEQSHLNVPEVLLKLDFYATMHAPLGIAASSWTATKIAPQDGEMTDCSAEWLNTQEELDTLGNLETP